MAAPLNLPAAEIDSRLAGDGLNQLVQGLSRLKLQGGGGELPIRPGFGTLGRVIKLRSNYFPVQEFPEYLYEYDVKVHPMHESVIFSDETPSLQHR
jgi:eukaryotic translation initiation factor 2C